MTQTSVKSEKKKKKKKKKKNSDKLMNKSLKESQNVTN